MAGHARGTDLETLFSEMTKAVAHACTRPPARDRAGRRPPASPMVKPPRWWCTQQDRQQVCPPSPFGRVGAAW